MTRPTSRSAAGGLLYRVARLAYQQLVFLKVVVRIHKVFRRLSHDDRFSVDPHPIKLYEMLLDRLLQQTPKEQTPVLRVPAVEAE